MPRPKIDDKRLPYSLRLNAEERCQLTWLAAHLDMTESATIRMALDSLEESARVADEVIELDNKETE